MANLNYGTYDEETADQEKEDMASSGAEFYKFKVGRNVLRILPPPPGKRSPFRVVFQHFIEMPGGSKSVICARLEAKKPCEVCMHVERLRKSKVDADQKAANDLFARRRVFANVIDRNDEAKGPKIAGFGKTVHEQLVALRSDPTAGGDYVHPEEGFDIVVERTGTSKNDTKYKVFLARKESPLERNGDTNVMQQWIDEQHNLDNYAKLPSVEQVRALLSGEEPEEEDVAPAAPPTRQTGARDQGVGRRAAPQQAAPPPRRGAPAPTTGKPRRNAEDDAIDVEGEEVDA